jgi:hypothetical protein
MAGGRTVDLAEEAALTPHRKLKELLRRLTVEHDLVTTTAGKEFRVAPIARFIGSRQFYNDRGDLKARELGKDGRPIAVEKVFKSKEIRFVEHYEQLLLDAARKFLEQGYERLPKGDPDYLPRYDQLVAAEVMRTAAARSLAAARDAKQRVGDEWAELQKQAQNDALAARLEQLKVLGAANDPRAEALAESLNLDYLDNPRVQREVQLWQLARWGERLDKADDTEFVEIRQRLDALERLFPGGLDEQAAPRLRGLRERLRRRAQEKYDAARALAKSKPGEAGKLLELAGRIDPELPGLQQFALQQAGDYPVLTAALESLPQRMSPAAARTDADRAAVDLIFESLVRPIASPAVGTDYRPGMASALPRVVPMGREFDLPAEGRWIGGPDGSPSGYVRAADAFQTLRELARRPDRPEFLDALDLERSAVESPTRLRLNFRRGLFEPLAWLDFKVLPGSFLNQGKPLDDPEFAARPVGSGAYRVQSADGLQAVFVFNPAYASRPGKEGRPAVREVRFIRMSDDLKERFRKGDVRLAVGVPTEKLAELLSPVPGLPEGTLKAVAPPHRRIHLLAIRHTHAALKDDRVRRAVAHAIDRDAILTDTFRAGQPKFHRPLAGPFPPHARWANHPNPEPDSPARSADRLFNPDKAKSLLAAAGFTPDKPLRLKVKFSQADDSRDKRVVGEIVRRVEELKVGLELTPEGVDDLSAALKAGDFELAYTTHDYANHLYSLGGLLESTLTGPGQANYFGFADGECDAVLQQIRSHRDFAELQERTRQLHGRFVQKWMPFVPLWQLDIHVVVRRELKTVPEPERLDPLAVFRHADAWRLARD